LLANVIASFEYVDVCENTARPEIQYDCMSNRKRAPELEQSLSDLRFAKLTLPAKSKNRADFREKIPILARANCLRIGGSEQAILSRHCALTQA
jgi:hypothetical protein